MKKPQVDFNQIISKRSSIIGLAIYLIHLVAQFPETLLQAGMSAGAILVIAVLTWRYMDLDHEKSQWRIAARQNEDGGGRKAEPPAKETNDATK